MADELHLRYNDQQAKQKLSKRGIDGIHGHRGGINGVHGLQFENGKSVKKLGSFCNDNGYHQERKGSICRSMAKELKMK